MGGWWAAVTTRDGIGIDDVLAFIAGASAILTFLSVWVIKPLRRAQQSLDDFMDAWRGIPAHPGHDSVPGIPERIQRIEREVQRNGGSSLKDRVFEIDRKVDALTASKEELRDDVQRLHTIVNRNLPTGDRRDPCP